MVFEQSSKTLNLKNRSSHSQCTNIITGNPLVQEASSSQHHYDFWGLICLFFYTGKIKIQDILACSFLDDLLEVCVTCITQGRVILLSQFASLLFLILVCLQDILREFATDYLDRKNWSYINTTILFSLVSSLAMFPRLKTLILLVNCKRLKKY